MSALNRDTWLLPLVGGLLMAPIGFLVVALLSKAMEGWSAWLVFPILGLVTVVASCVLCVVAIRIAAWWRRHRGRGQ